jgi:hypothetical protein
MEACTAVHHTVQIYYGHSVLEGIDTPLNMNASDVGQFPGPLFGLRRPRSLRGVRLELACLQWDVE